MNEHSHYEHGSRYADLMHAMMSLHHARTQVDAVDVIGDSDLSAWGEMVSLKRGSRR